MRPEQRPPTVGILACLAYLLAVFLPYVLLDGEALSGLRVYYAEYGIAGPQYLSLLAAVGVILFAAGREARTEPDYAAGLTLVLSGVLFFLVLGWAALVPEDVVLTIGEVAWFEYHRWVVLACTALMVASAAWYARALSLV